jgi:hypothetical protein
MDLPISLPKLNCFLMDDSSQYISSEEHTPNATINNQHRNNKPGKALSALVKRELYCKQMF